MQRGNYSVVKVRKYKTIFHVTLKQKERNNDQSTVDLHDCIKLHCVCSRKCLLQVYLIEII